ncbi:hypothetical protein [Leisingera sp. M523]|uniref:hypothetical protein n=1 Tax=Leisingera sp. M523 TaxID=2867013 RepID=UPI0021A76A9E|nr:hypothetical protein [Leisingera sp. M523]UWQ29924.1 hypothetical protein K3557_05080 [Leisingera sp. M523]
MNAPVLDACCGSRMFWFDRKDDRAVFGDQRRETHTLKDKSSKGGSRELIIDPDVMMDFRDMPFPAGTFSLVVFDPPHLIDCGPKSWLALKYGKLRNDWRKDLRAGLPITTTACSPNTRLTKPAASTTNPAKPGPRTRKSPGNHRGFLPDRVSTLPLQSSSARRSLPHRISIC